MGKRPETFRGNIIERTMIWQESKVKKLEQLKENTVEKGIEECTFKPKINNQPLYLEKSKS